MIQAQGVEVILDAYIDIKGKKLNWLDEINKCVLFRARIGVPIVECLKEIMISNGVALSYGNIEKMKLELVRFAKIGRENTGLTRTSEIFLSKEDKKFMPLVEDQWRSHLFIRDVVWDAYKKRNLNLNLKK